MKGYRIRAHHGMCLAFFQGMGYSEEFAKHMGKIKQGMEKNPRVCIIDEADDICVYCPNCVSGSCQTAEKAEGYDRRVLALCGLEAGSEMEWMDFKKLVKEKVLDAGKRKAVCGDCQWDEFC